MKELVVDAVRENLGKVQDFVQRGLDSVGCSDSMKRTIICVAEEIFINIADYAYTCTHLANKAGKATIMLSLGDDIMLIFRDNGVKFNPLDYQTPNFDDDIEDRELGKIGIPMIKYYMDSVDYKYEANTNILTIRKQINLM